MRGYPLKREDYKKILLIKNMKTIKILLILVVIFTFNITNAAKLYTPHIEGIYNSFIKKVERKYS